MNNSSGSFQEHFLTTINPLSQLQLLLQELSSISNCQPFRCPSSLRTVTTAKRQPAIDQARCLQQKNPRLQFAAEQTDFSSPNTPSSSNLNRIPGLGLLDSEQQNSSNSNLSTFISTPLNPLPGIFLPDHSPTQQVPNLTDRHPSPANSAKSTDSDSAFASIYNTTSPKSVPMDISPSSKSDTTTNPALPSFFVAIKTRTSDQSMQTISENGPVASSETRVLGAFIKEEDANNAVRRAQGEADVEFGEQEWTTGVGSTGGLKLSFSTYPGWIDEPVAIVLCAEKVEVVGGASGDQAGS